MNYSQCRGKEAGLASLFASAGNEDDQRRSCRTRLFGIWPLWLRSAQPRRKARPQQCSRRFIRSLRYVASRLLLDDASCVSRRTPEINKLLCGLARIAHERYRRRRAFIHDGAQARRSERLRSKSNRGIGVAVLQVRPN
jgi:hypothetical protein